MKNRAVSMGVAAPWTEACTGLLKRCDRRVPRGSDMISAEVLLSIIFMMGFRRIAQF